MGSSSLRVIVEMLWEKEQNLEALLELGNNPQLYELPHEKLWRQMLKAAGRPSLLPESMGGGREQLLLGCYGHLVQSRKMRRDMKELTDMIVQIQLFQRLLGAISGLAKDPGALYDGVKLTGDHVDELYTLLHNVQKKDNPLAIRPQSEAADTLEEDMQKLSKFFEAGQPIRITTTD